VAARHRFIPGGIVAAVAIGYALDLSLIDLLALFSRYRIPMGQLAQFRTTRNESWFAAPQMYWHTRVFGKSAR